MEIKRKICDIRTWKKHLYLDLRSRGADKSFDFSRFLFAAQPKEFFLDGLEKLD
jgi:hypothetical protein